MGFGIWPKRRKDAGPGVHFMSPHLDYCNSLFYSITEGLMSWLQSTVCPECGCTLLSDIALTYLAADYKMVSDEGRCQLRSATSMTCVVRLTYSNYGDRCFAAARPKLWNSLPAEMW